MSARRGEAIVLGSSVAGLVAARVLAERFEQVTLVDRDAAPEGATPRKGIPQGRHVHALLRGGEDVLEELFPGFVAALEARGSTPFDWGAEVRWFHHGVWKKRFHSGFTCHSQSRPLLEAVLREHVARLPNVRFRPRTVATGLLFDEARTRVTGVRLRGADEQGPGEEVSAAFVLDASGRGSQLPAWLEGAGFPVPEEERVGMDLAYASRVYEGVPEGDWKVLLVYQDPPKETRFGGMVPLEGGRWMVTLGGYCGDHPPTDEEGFLAFARSLGRPELSEAIRTLRPVSEIAAHKVPFARWRHYERVARFPAGLAAAGDSVCSFDPVFGQGMSIAAKEGRLLGEWLRRDPDAARPRDFLRSSARQVGVAWLLATSENFRYPQVSGPRPKGLGLLQAYTKRVFRLTAQDTGVYTRFFHVMHLVRGPEALFHPSVVAGVLGALVRRPVQSAREPAPQIAAQ